MRYLPLCAAIALAAVACEGSAPSQQTDDVREQEGRYETDPVDDKNPGLAFLANVSHAGNYLAADGATVRVFELYEDNRIEVAVATHGADVDYVWNLTEAIGVGVDEIDSIKQPRAGQLDVWVAEDDGGWGVYRIDLNGRTLSVTREIFADYVEPGSEGKATLQEKYALQPDPDKRYGSLSRFRDISVVNFEYALGSATILELTAGDNAEIFIGLRVGGGEPLIYRTEAIVKDVGAAYEIEPGYFDMQIEPVCPHGDSSCTNGFDAIGIDFEISSDGRELTSETIEVDLKHGVG